MHYWKLTSIRMGGGRFLCIQIGAQQAQAALQGITHSPVQTLSRSASRSALCLSYHLVLFMRIWGRKQKNNLLTPWNQPPSDSERATETIRKQEWSGFSLSLFLSLFPLCAHHHSSWLLCCRTTISGAAEAERYTFTFPQGDHYVLDKSCRCYTLETAQDGHNERHNSLPSSNAH